MHRSAWTGETFLSLRDQTHALFKVAIYLGKRQQRA